MDRRAIFHVHKNAVYRLEAEATSAAMTQPRKHCDESLILAIITGHVGRGMTGLGERLFPRPIQKLLERNCCASHIYHWFNASVVYQLKFR